MIRLSPRLLTRAAAAMLVVPGAAPLAAQSQSGTFNLPAPAPTPTPAPAGPADERSGVLIPPRAAPSPVPTPVPTRVPAPVPTLTPAPLPSEAAAAPRPSTVRPSATPQPRPAAGLPSPRPAAPAGQAPAPVPTAPIDSAAAPGQVIPPPVRSTPVPLPAPFVSPEIAASPMSPWWPWALAGLGLLATLGLGAVLFRRRGPKVLRLAPPPARMEGDADTPLPRIDITLEIISTTRSVMMFTVQYRLTLANRAAFAANDLDVSVELASARRGADAAPAGAAARRSARVDRVGPHQSRSITGEVQLPLAAITPLRQGRAAVFVPLLHVAVEAEGPVAARSFVIGQPSAAGRLHPVLLDTAPGSIPGLRAQSITLPDPPGGA